MSQRRSSAGSTGVGHPAVVGDAHRLPFADGSVDVVLAAWVLAALADVEAAALEIHRVLRPDGQLLAIATTRSPHPADPHHRLLLRLVHEPLGRPLRRAIVSDLPFSLVAQHTSRGGLVSAVLFRATAAGCCAQPAHGP